MANVRGMLARVRRLEVARSTASPIARLYGSFEAYAEGVQADIDAGKLDGIDMPVILDCLRRWERERLWGQWSNTGAAPWSTA